MNCHDLRQGPITFAVLGLAVVLVSCGGSGKTTLQGTFSDRWDVSNQDGACADQLSDTSITVAVDNVSGGQCPRHLPGESREHWHRLRRAGGVRSARAHGRSLSRLRA